MTIRHHPDVSTLMSCSAGSQPEANAAVVSSHLAVCPKCRKDVGRMAEIGVALFDRLKPVDMTLALDLPTLRSREADTPSSKAITANSSGDVPLPLTGLLGTSLDTVPWKRLSPGVWHHQIELSPGAKGALHLLKVAPGTKLPRHGHDGEELTLVLKGSYRDAGDVFRAGDISDLDDQTEHEPVADDETGCICLIATERPLKFKGLVARLFQPLTGM